VRLTLTLALSAALLAGCDAWALSIGSDGLVFVSIVDDGGHRPRGGYRIRVRADGGSPYETALPADGRLRLEPAPRGPVELTLLPPEGCSVIGPVTRIVAPTADGTARASFRLAC
jgi:hypothetical protein